MKSFKVLRTKDPGATIILHFYELPCNQELLDMSVLFPGGIVASYSMPWLSIRSGQCRMTLLLTLVTQEPSADSSPNMYVSAMLSAYLRKTALLPAKLLEDSVPRMKKKGRIQAGMDADPIKRASDEVCAVNGVFVTRDGELDTEVFPGKPVRRLDEGE